MKDTLVMILAGGVGKRLSILSQLRAKPAVPFGGIYRIIDFTLSNVMNSGLGAVALLPQYKPLSLIEHIGIGVPWDFNGRTRSINILPPSTGRKDSDWYRGTADAIRQNLSYIQDFDPEYLLVLSGDHIYSMDYSLMINFHREHDADVTVGMIPVPLKNANNFGIAAVDSDNKIIDWEEKPKHPKSDLASMGIYVFSTKFIVNQLQLLSGEDFGHDLIPVFVENHNTYGFTFDGYWRDVGTVQAYWESNMEILIADSGLEIQDWNLATNFEEDGRIGDRPPTHIAATAKISDSFISHGCSIAGTVKNSVISSGVKIGRGTVVADSIVMHDSHIGCDSSLHYCIVDKEVRIGDKCRLGKEGADSAHLCLIGKGSTIPDGMSIGEFCTVYPVTDLTDFTSKKIADFQTVGDPL